MEQEKGISDSFKEYPKFSAELLRYFGVPDGVIERTKVATITMRPGSLPVLNLVYLSTTELGDPVRVKERWSVNLQRMGAPYGEADAADE